MTPQSPTYKWHRFLQAVRRRGYRPRIESVYQSLVASWDQPAFRERFRPFWDPFADTRPPKFLNVEVWLREAVARYLLLVGPDAPPSRVLDIGAGTGYFLLVCRHHGHPVTGLDIPGEPIYDACFEFFELPRIEHRIEPYQPLPAEAQPLELVTALMTCFNYDEGGRAWEAGPWHYLLEDVRRRMTAGGRFILKFNLEPESGRFYSPEVKRAIAQAAGFRTRFFLDYAILRAV